MVAPNSTTEICGLRIENLGDKSARGGNSQLARNAPSTKLKTPAKRAKMRCVVWARSTVE